MIVAILVSVWIGRVVDEAHHAYVDMRSHIRQGEFDLGDLPVNDATKTALTLKLDQSKNLFTYNVALLSILWGLILFKKEGPVLSWGDVPEGIIFLIANVAVVANGFCHTLYVRLVGELATAGGKGTDSKMSPIRILFTKCNSRITEVSAHNRPSTIGPEHHSTLVGRFQ